MVAGVMGPNEDIQGIVLLLCCQILRPFLLGDVDQAAVYRLTEVATSLLPMGNATFATGMRSGQIQIHHLRDDKLDLLAQNSAPETQGCQAADMHFSKGKGCIYALHDSSNLRAPRRNYLRCGALSHLRRSNSCMLVPTYLFK